MTISRRSIVKAGVGASAAAAIWAEPTIHGLARRPAYASTTSSAIITNFNGTLGFTNAGPPASTTLGTQTFGALAVDLVLAGSGSNWTISATASDLACECGITAGFADATATLFFLGIFPFDSAEVAGVLSGGVMQFTLPADPFLSQYRMTSVTWNVDVTCT